MKPTAGVLFAGVGAACLGLQRAGFEIVYQCEIDPFCRSVLDVRFPNSQKYKDIKHVKNAPTTDIIFGSPPCQPYSQAGKQRGNSDDRALWPEMRRIVEESRPAWVILENVAGICKLVQFPEIFGMGSERDCELQDGEEKDREGRGILDGILEDFEKIGYDVVPFVIPACAVDAPHRRDRLWIVANSKGRHERPGVSESRERSEPESRNGSRTGPVSNSDSQGLQERESIEKNDGAEQQTAERGCGGPGTDADSQHGNNRGLRAGEIQRGKKAEISERQFWPSESGLDRVDDGHAPGMDRPKHTKLRNSRTRALGNAVVPQIVERIGRMIIACS